MAVEMVPVESSNISRVGYDSSASELYVEFKSGGRYVYEKVPETVFQAMLGAPSAGRFLHQQIKSRYPYRRLA